MDWDCSSNFETTEHGFPVWCPLPETVDAFDVFRALSSLPHVVFLDSARRHPSLGRYSYVAADPLEYREFSAGDQTVWSQLTDWIEVCESVAVQALPRFQGGLAGMFSYDLGRSIERLPEPRFDEFQCPAVALGRYDVVFAFDHVERRSWAVSQGWESKPAGALSEGDGRFEHPSPSRHERARTRLTWFLKQLDPVAQREATMIGNWPWPSGAERGAEHTRPVGPHVAVRPPGGGRAPHTLFSNFDAHGYRAAVRRAIDYIYAGDIFQVNLAQRLLVPATMGAGELYETLRRENPAPFAGFFDLGTTQLLSASPERFLQVADGYVETRPIKGTRPRHGLTEADLFTGDELRASEKDRAENVMIVDLMRNDLSRVCQPDTVRVTELCQVEAYQDVQHLVSAVTGQLSEMDSSLDLLRGTFPGGSITGAPKIRAMEIIAEIEPHARGPYCGSLGYLNWDGAMDLSILIRSIAGGQGWWRLPVGGGIVAQSDPDSEYTETWHKATGMLRAIREAEDRHVVGH